MKKLILVIAILLAGAMSCSKSDKEEKPNENKKINAPASSNIKEENYETGMVQRMEDYKKGSTASLEFRSYSRYE